jgi:Ca2+-binding RTX toxin-like protein
VAGTLNGGETRTVEVASSSTDTGTTEVAVNVAGVGTLVVKAGDEVITITVAADGTTTITPDGGEPILVKGEDGKTAGTVEIKITPQGVTYSLVDPGTKTVQIGNATASIPGTATITKEEGKITYQLRGSGECEADLDPGVSNVFNAGAAIQCTIDQGPTGTTARALRAGGGKHSDTIRTGNLADRISAGPGADLVNSRGGNDLVRGDHSLASMGLSASLRHAYAAAVKRISGPDRLRAGAGNDRVFGDGGNDTIWGQSGADRLLGNLGDDRIFGGGGDDVIDGGAGRDQIDAGAGDDIVRADSNGKDSVGCGAGNDTVYAGPFDVIRSDCEKVVRSS